jgi:hypothetical protein
MHSNRDAECCGGSFAPACVPGQNEYRTKGEPRTSIARDKHPAISHVFSRRLPSLHKNHYTKDFVLGVLYSLEFRHQRF